MLIYFNLYKNRKLNDKQPDYKFSVKSVNPNSQYEHVFFGGAWIRESKHGEYLSCSVDPEKLKLAGYNLKADDEFAIQEQEIYKDQEQISF